MPERLVVVGGDAAGMSAASQARRRRGPDDLHIVVFEQGQYTSYSACGIPYLVGGEVADIDDLVARAPEQFRSRFAIDVRLGAKVVGVDIDRRTVTWEPIGGGAPATEPYDQLVLATGARPVRPPGLEGDTPGVFDVHTLDDAQRIGRYVADRAPRTAVVVGAGYIGLEMAEALLRLGLQVTVVEAAATPMSTLDPDMGAFVAEALRQAGAQLRTGVRVQAVGRLGEQVHEVVTDAGVLPADVVVVGLGVAPRVELAAEAGVPIGPSGAIAVDRRMRTAVPGVWAAGDCVESFHRVSRQPVVVALGTHANKQGRVAGINIGGGYGSFPGVLGTAISKICGTEVARTGLSEAEAGAAGFDTVAVVVDSTTRAGYFPGTAPIRTKFVAEQLSGRLLGAQIVGGDGAAKRIDTIAVAVWNAMTVDDMIGLDLAYAPPFAPVWDPVLVAARKAVDALGR